MSIIIIGECFADDPAPFEAELAQREKQLGPNHPDVAEACSNLAILYNQKGETSQALPLYERALKIYEKHFGPEHPEVAHTLTDLAVLHLEQVRPKSTPHLHRLFCMAFTSLTKLSCEDYNDTCAFADTALCLQGRDGVGRPLLERALVIQERALGPDHPDVIAIKDVLNSE